jgi:hypothetical protein
MVEVLGGNRSQNVLAGARARPAADSSRASYSVPEDFAGLLGLGVLFAASPEALESPEEGELDDELPAPVLGFDSDDDDEFPPDSLLSAFLRDSEG